MPYSPSDIPKQIGSKTVALRDRRFLEFYLDGRPLYECEKHAGNRSTNKQSLSVSGCERLKRLNISFADLCEIKGLSDDLLAVKMREGLEAYKVGFATFRGKISDTIKTPDFTARSKFVELLAKAKGKLKDTTELTGKDGGDIVLQVVPPARSGKQRAIELEE